MSISLDDEILAAIAKNGSFEDVESLGYTPSQVVFGVRRLLEAGLLIRGNRGFKLADNVQIPQAHPKKWKNLDILSEYSIEKIDLNEEYEIGHQSFAQIHERVRP
ncbi:LysR family transcriptional regulator [Brucella anthropi]|uniref:LysR family transcriptional regulator n=1 Tax=Brucella anthropi TaxID=529 RepID=UPI000774FED1|nr:LysR family transcriptional regulator [Brucella anthropi]KXO77726.1 hypothetical protein AYJ56_19720 [Brucella anthropi]